MKEVIKMAQLYISSAYRCIDCQTLLVTREDKETSSTCNVCHSIVCANCAIYDDDQYCQGCYNEIMIHEDDLFV